MKPTINFFKSNTGKIFLFSDLILALIIFSVYGAKPAIVYMFATLAIFFIALVWRVYPNEKKLFFYNVHGKFEIYDIVYDRGSATRPTVPGILKNDGSGWFMIYDDGFEWPISATKNVEMFIYQTSE